MMARVIDKSALTDFKRHLTESKMSREEKISLSIASAIFILNVRDFKLADEESIKQLTVGYLPEFLIQTALDILETEPRDVINATLEALVKEATFRRKHLQDKLEV